MKRLLLQHMPAHLLLQARDAVDLVRTALRSPHELGSVLNDQLAVELVSRISRPQKTFIDIGAHIGSVVAAVLHHVPTAKVVAVEPMSDKAEHLRRSFPQIELHECALADTPGEKAFFINDDLSGYSSLLRAEAEKAGKVREARVRVSTLDTIANGADVDAIKIDVEGAELGVFKGGARLLSQTRPLVMFESSPSAHSGNDAKGEVWDLLTQYGYRIVVPNRLAHDHNALTREGFLDCHFYPFRCTNFFAVPDERGDEVRQRASAL